MKFFFLSSVWNSGSLLHLITVNLPKAMTPPIQNWKLRKGDYNYLLEIKVTPLVYAYFTRKMRPKYQASKKKKQRKRLTTDALVRKKNIAETKQCSSIKLKATCSQRFNWLCELSNVRFIYWAFPFQLKRNYF